MEEHLSPLAVTHLLQYTLRTLCLQENSKWVYAVFWRILPRNFPPPKWDSQEGAYGRLRGNRRNWILVWEDGFCNFAASTALVINSGEDPISSVCGSCEIQHFQGLQPEIFFKMSHEIYNYGESLIGKVAADCNHRWVHKDANEQGIDFVSPRHNSTDDSQPRTWEAQFQSGIETIALIAVREGVVQLGSLHKMVEDLSYVVLVRRKFSYLESIPGVLLPHPSSSPFPYMVPGYGGPEIPHYHTTPAPSFEYAVDHFTQPMKITPSMSSLEALLSKLPSVVPAPPPQQVAMHGFQPQQQFLASPNNRPIELMRSVEEVAKKEKEEEHACMEVVAGCSNLLSSNHQLLGRQNRPHRHQDFNMATGSRPPTMEFEKE
ncbi:hypothetical protein Nepgr_027969 [Nepenthes gracilis]|uniref:Transcription factor MYC/MYB N-terminal domain-containing protein n=1 Tax=Nepenthes gracilis TaxID=150966 RepID=A0AAD3TBI4_NEPGR|nr:hypothetical protein Nepgr_027969 [Nepenthes gracilis]